MAQNETLHKSYGISKIDWTASFQIKKINKYDFAQKDLQSFMTFDVEHFHVATYYETSVMTMLQYCRSFGESMKANIKKKYQIGEPITLQITVENMVSFNDISQLSQPSTVKISSKDQQALI